MTIEALEVAHIIVNSAFNFHDTPPDVSAEPE
jgi:hypothetical protein